MKKQTSVLLILITVLFFSCGSAKFLYDHNFEQNTVVTEDTTGKKTTSKAIKKSTTISVEYTPNDSIRPLKIGDKVPDVLLENVVNWPGGKAKLSDFKGKLLVLDFWNLGCAPCIASFPKLEKLQEKFGSRIQILLVNVLNTSKSIKKDGFPANSSSRIIQNTKLPFVLFSDEMAKLFPHPLEPFHVWVDQSGKVYAQTESQSTSEKTLQSFLSGTQVQLPTLLDGEKLQIKNGSLIQSGTKEVLDNLVYFSAISTNPFIVDVAGYITDSATGNIIGMRGKARLIDLYAEFYPKLMSNRDRIFLDLNDPSIFIEPVHADSLLEWRRKNIYYYELRLPHNDKLTILDMGSGRENILNKALKNDFERYLNVKSSWEKRKVRCYILTRLNDNSKVLARKGGYSVTQNVSGEGLVLKNAGLNSLISAIAHNVSLRGTPIIPVIDETGWSNGDVFNLEIRTFHDFNKLKSDLIRQGIDISIAEREIEVVVIKSLNSN